MWNFTKQVLWTKDQNAWSWENRINVSLFFYLLTKPRFRQNLLRKLKNIWMLLFLLSIIIFILIFLWKQNIMLQEVNAKTENKKQVQKEVKYDNIRQVLRLDNCRVTQNEDSHITERWWHMYAQDIACEKWKSFEVKAPKWKDKYLVVKNNWDKRLWDYIVLKHWEYLFVFAHTKSNLRSWTRIKKWDSIWYVNKSWMSENFHLHFELWKSNYNISYKEMLWQNTLFNMEHTYDLRKQRKWYLETQETMDYLSHVEWYRACPYKDNTRYSIGFWTISTKNAKCITREMAIELKRWRVEDILKQVYQKHFVPNRYQRMALVSMLYNKWDNSRIANIKNRHTKEWVKAYVYEYIKANTNKKYLKWIFNRANKDLNLYFKWM